jgi:hypothetical protein
MGNGYAPEVMTELYVPANRPFYFGFHRATSGSFVTSGITISSSSSCRFYMAFDPLENVDYEAAFRMGTSVCTASVYRIVPNPSGGYMKEEEASARPLRECMK